MPSFPILILAGSLSFGGPKRASPPDRWFGRDKAYHFTASLMLQAAGQSVLRANRLSYREAAWTAAGLTMGLGIAKELRDRRGQGVASWRDLAADAAGTGAGAIVVRQVAP